MQQSDARKGLGLSLLAAGTFGTSGSFAESLISAGWSAASVVVVPAPKLALGWTTFAIAGSAVVLRMIPKMSDPSEPISTERRGPRRGVEPLPLGSPERFCPCVILVMDQLSKIKSKVPPTVAQHPLNSIEKA